MHDQLAAKWSTAPQINLKNQEISSRHKFICLPLQLTPKHTNLIFIQPTWYTWIYNQIRQLYLKLAKTSPIKKSLKILYNQYQNGIWFTYIPYFLSEMLINAFNYYRLT